MVSTEVEFSDEQMEKLRKVSQATGQSIPELVRLGVDYYLSSRNDADIRAIRERAINAAGKFASEGPNDVSERVDDYLDEAFGHW